MVRTCGNHRACSVSAEPCTLLTSFRHNVYTVCLHPEVLRYPPPAGASRSTVCSGEAIEKPPKYVAVVARHGARFPTVHKMAAVVDFANRICSAKNEGQRVPEEAVRWCAMVERDVKGLRPGTLSALGWDEMRTMGWWAATTYLAPLQKQGSLVEMTLTTSSSERCVDSCIAFLEGSEELYDDSIVPSEPCKNIQNHLLRPYWDCPRLQAVRRAFDPPHAEGDDFVREALQQLSAVTGLPLPHNMSSTDIPEGVTTLEKNDVRGAYYGCQTDVSLNGGSFDKSWACGALGSDLMLPFDDEEDTENFLLRGFGKHEVTRQVDLPLLQKITAGMEKVMQWGEEQNSEPRALAEFFFTHDSTVLPLSALMKVFDLGSSPHTSQASQYCPFSSRLVVEVADCGAILVYYNDALVRVFSGGLTEWQSFYEDLLSSSFEEACELPEPDYELRHQDL